MDGPGLSPNTNRAVTLTSTARWVPEQMSTWLIVSCSVENFEILSFLFHLCKISDSATCIGNDNDYDYDYDNDYDYDYDYDNDYDYYDYY